MERKRKPRGGSPKKPGGPARPSVTRKPPADPELELRVGELRRRFLAQVSSRMERRRMTRAELAQRLGVSRGFVTQLLGGTSNLTLRTMAAVSRALDCELEIDLRKPRFTLPPGLKLELAAPPSGKKGPAS